MSEEQDNRDTATRIFDAADELFGQLGFEGVSVRDVAERAGVNKALVFYHHNSKEELFEKVLQRYYDAHHHALLEASEVDVEGTRARLHGVIDVYLDFIDSHQRYPRLVQNLLSGPPRHLKFIQQALAPLFLWTERALEGIAPAEGPLAARHFYVTISGAVINYFTYSDALEGVWGRDMTSPEAVEERREHLHWVLDVFLDGLAREQGIEL